MTDVPKAVDTGSIIQPRPPVTQPDAQTAGLGIKPEQVGNPMLNPPDSIVSTQEQLAQRQLEGKEIEEIIAAANKIDNLDPQVHKNIGDVLTQFAQTGNARSLLARRIKELNEKADSGSIDQNAFSKEQAIIKRIEAVLTKQQQELDLTLETAGNNTQGS